MSIEIARERVDAGALLLDEKRPGWHRDIDLEALRLASETKCVLGQLFNEDHSVPQWQVEDIGTSREEAIQFYMKYDGISREDASAAVDHRICVANYDAGSALLGLGRNGCIEHGFDSKWGDDDEPIVTYRELEEAWSALIRERQEQESFAGSI